MATFGELMDDIHHLSIGIDNVVSERNELREALLAAAEAIRDFDGGDQNSETGWKHDELREAWVAARDVLTRTNGYDIFVLRQQIADLPEPGKATTLLMIAAALVNMPDDPAKAREFYATIRREIERVWPQVKP